jgi:hypothetical protein
MGQNGGSMLDWKFYDEKFMVHSCNLQISRKFFVYTTVSEKYGPIYKRNRYWNLG